jgi:hypothetical protein
MEKDLKSFTNPKSPVGRSSENIPGRSKTKKIDLVVFLECSHSKDLKIAFDTT